MIVDGEEYYNKYFESNVKAFEYANVLKNRYSQMFSNRGYEIYVEKPNQTSYGRAARDRIAVFQYDTKGYLVAEHESLSLAAKSVGVVYSAIHYAMDKRKPCAGFMWKRK